MPSTGIEPVTFPTKPIFIIKLNSLIMQQMNYKITFFDVWYVSAFNVIKRRFSMSKKTKILKSTNS
jgi:hypothetical protein